MRLMGMKHDADIDALKRQLDEANAALAALRGSETNYQALFRSFDEGVLEVEVVQDANGRVVDWRYMALNSAFERLTGLKDVTGRLVSEVMPDLEPAWAERYTHVVNTGEAARFELPASGVGRWFSIYLARIGDAGSRRVVVLYSDVTERKRAELAQQESDEQQAFLLKFSDALRAEPDAEAIANRALRMLMEQMRLDRCYLGIYRLAEDLGEFPHQVHDDRLPPLPAGVRLSDFPEALQVAFDRTLVINDVVEMEGLSDTDRASFTGLGMSALISATLRKGENNPLWAINAISSSPRVWTQGEVALVEEVAERIWAAVEGSRAEAALHASEAKYRMLFDGMDQGFYIAQVVEDETGRAVDRRFLEVNPAMEQISGLSNVVGRLMSEFAPNAEAQWIEPFEHVVRTGEPRHVEDFNVDTGRWYRASHTRIGGQSSRLVGVVFDDITERKQAETDMRANEARQAFLLKFSDALRLHGDTVEIQTAALRVLGEHLGAVRAQYWLVEPDGQQANSEGGYAEEGPRIFGRVRLNDFGVHVIEALTAGLTVRVSDVTTDPLASAEVMAAYEAVEVRAYITVPLVKGGRLVAMLAVNDTAARDWTSQEVALVEEAAERTWAAVERAQAEAALRESEERFSQFAASSTDVLWIRRADTMEMEYLSPAFATVYGMDPEAAIGAVRLWAALIVPEDRDVALGHLERARLGAAAVHEFRIRRPSDGAFRWIRDHDFPLYDANGVKWVGGIGTDVTEAKLLAGHQSMLLAELQHRVRNIMAMLLSVVTRSARTASDVADYESLVTGRLMALTRTQALLTRAANVGVEINALIRQELEALADHEGQYVLTGCEVVISPKAAEIVSLAVHELATNALKYGALSTPEGTVEVTVRVLEADDAPRLRLEWSERRPVPPDWSPPKRKGFGTQLIEQRVPYELRGRGEVVIEPEGAKAFIEFPLQPGSSILETDAPKPSVVYGGAIDMTGEPSLAGHSVLILEDDFYLAQDAKAALHEAGAEVIGPFSTITDATEAIKNRRITAAMLDVNLGDGPSFEVAHAMRGAGAPFVFVTGYDQDAIPAEFAQVVRLEKPIGPRDIVRAIGALAQA